MSHEFLQPYEPSPGELLDRALRDPILPGRQERILGGFGVSGATKEKPPYFQAPPYPLAPPPPRRIHPEVSASGVRGPNDTEVIDAHTYACGMLMQAALDERNLVEDRAQMYTAGWLLRQGQKESAYPLLAEVKDPELRRLTLTTMNALVAEHHTMAAGIERVSIDSELGQQWLHGAFERAAEAEGYTDMLGFANRVARTFTALTNVDRQKIEGMIVSGFGVDDSRVTDLLVTYLDMMQQQNAERAHDTQARKAVANLKGMLAQYWANPEDVTQTVRICNTMSSEEDARSLVTHVFEPFLAGFCQMPTNKIMEIWTKIEDFNVLLQVTTETNWMIRKIDIFALAKVVKDMEARGDIEGKRLTDLKFAVRHRAVKRGGPIGVI